jgi:SAM-dependent methyltransferase
MDPTAFVLSQLPPPPARVLEVGCGNGVLALALDVAGYDVTAIDPEAPDGAIFERVTLEEFGGSGPFDAVVAIISLHHVAELAPALDKLARLLEPGGVIVLDEWAKERFRGTTARWYYRQRQALAEVKGEEVVTAPFEDWLRDWLAELDDIHSFDKLHAELERRFAQRLLEFGPYLYRYKLDEDLEPLERKLIEEGSIEALGVRYVGEKRG